MTIVLRPYQREALDAVHREFGSVRSTLLVAPTGSGKTTMFAAMAYERRALGRTLIIAHREELVSQAAARVRAQTGLAVGVEMADSVASTLAPENVVVASVQTLCRAKRRAKFRPEEFATLIIDEAHHALASSYRAIEEHFHTAKVLGVTATPDRGDELALGDLFQTVAFEYSIEAAITTGFLVDVIQKSVHCEALDYSAVRTRMGDLSESDLQQVLEVDGALHQIAGPLVRETGSRPAVVFMPGVASSHALADVLRGYTSARVGVVDGKMSKDMRREVLADYSAGKVQFIINCAVLTEGWDAPHTACVAVARATKSRALYAQMIGRGLRPHPESGKTDCLVLDFKGNAGKHRLCNPMDILGGNAPQNVRELAAEMAQARGLSSRVALGKAAEMVAREDALEKERQRRKREEAARKRASVAVQYSANVVSAFGAVGMDVPKRTTTEPALTDKQRAFLEAQGLKTDDLSALGVRGAGKAIDGILDRQRRGLASFKQARLLVKYGYSADVTKAQASQIIDRLAANGWRRPSEQVAV